MAIKYDKILGKIRENDSLSIGGTVTGLTAGSILFGGALGVLAQDNANIFYDDTNNTIGFGTTRTGAISGTNPTVRIKGTGATSATSSFEVQDSAGATIFFVRNDGNVGVGTNNPGTALGAKFHVAGNVNGALYAGIFQNANAGGSALAGFQVACDSASINMTVRSNSTAYVNPQFGVAGARLQSLYANNAPMMFGCGDNYPVYIVTNAAVRLYVANDGKVGFGTITPTNDLSLSGQSARKFWLERHTTANTAGNTLTIQAGGATALATDKAGGDMLYYPGTSTGSAESGHQMYGCVAGVSGTADRSMTKMFQILGNKWALNSATPTATQTGWTTSNVTTDRIIDANASTLDETLDVLCTLIEDLKTKGVLEA